MSETEGQTQEQSQEQEQSQPTAGEQKAQERADAPRGPVTSDQVSTLTPEPGEDVGESRVQEVIDAELEHGFRGVKTDLTPNEAYSVEGVTSGHETPETNPELRVKNRQERRLDGPHPY